MRTRFVSFAGTGFLVIAVGLVAASAGSAGHAAPGDQRSMAQASQKSAGPSMVVYKSPT